MKKNLLLYILLGFLILMNCFFLFKYFGGPNQNERQKPAPGNFIVKELAFDTSQTQQFEKLDVAHRGKMDAILDDIKATKDVLFDKLSDNTSETSEIDSIARIVANKEVKKELETFRFFKAVGEICDEKQKVKFKSIIKHALRRQGPPGRNGPPPGGKGDEGRPPPPNGHGEEGRPPPPRH